MCAARLLREELQLVQEPGSYVGEVARAMGKKKVLVKEPNGERNPAAKGMQQISLHTKVSQGAGVSACAREADKRAIRQARTAESREGEHLD